MTWQRTHFIIGLATVVTFLGTGLYMRTYFPALYGDNAAVRFLYRANHIYILSAGLVNLMVGIYLRPHAGVWQRRAQRLGSALLLVASPLLVTAFFVEPPMASPDRSLTFYGIVALFGGGLLHVPSVVGARDQRIG